MWKWKMRVQTIQILLWFDHPRLKGHTISLAKTSSEFKLQCFVCFLFFIVTPQTPPTFWRQTPRDSAPVSPPEGLQPLQGSKWVGPGPQWPRAGLQAATLGAQAPRTANLRDLGQSSACEWVRWRVWRQQTAAQSLSQAWWHQTRD